MRSCQQLITSTGVWCNGITLMQQHHRHHPMQASNWVAAILKLPATCRRKVRMTSSRHDPYGLGYTRVTMATTKGGNGASRSEPEKSCLSSDCSLQLESMKLESLVIVDQHATVNLYLGLVLPARHAPEVEWLRSLTNPPSMLFLVAPVRCAQPSPPWVSLAWGK